MLLMYHTIHILHVCVYAVLEDHQGAEDSSEVDWYTAFYWGEVATLVYMHKHGRFSMVMVMEADLWEHTLTLQSLHVV